MTSFHQTSGYNSAHQIIGLVVFALLAFQALGGLLHHILFRRGKKTIIGKVHMVLGFCLIILGIVNAPLGLNFAGDGNYNKYYIIVVCIVAAIFFVVRFYALWSDKRKATRSGSEKGVLRESGSEENGLHSQVSR